MNAKLADVAKNREVQGLKEVIGLREGVDYTDDEKAQGDKTNRKPVNQRYKEARDAARAELASAQARTAKVEQDADAALEEALEWQRMFNAAKEQLEAYRTQLEELGVDLDPRVQENAKLKAELANTAAKEERAKREAAKRQQQESESARAGLVQRLQSEADAAAETLGLDSAHILAAYKQHVIATRPGDEFPSVAQVAKIIARDPRYGARRKAQDDIKRQLQTSRQAPTTSKPGAPTVPRPGRLSIDDAVAELDRKLGPGWAGA
jgi:chromosome segregation ATPase